MNDFKFMIPQTIEFGVGALKKLPEIMKENDLDHVFLISDHGLEALGVVKKIQDIVEEAGLQCTTYLDIQANPTSAIVADATDKYRECGASSIIALGGGGPMDVAKANPEFEDGRSLEGVAPTRHPSVPIIAIPTTAGTGSEVTASAVITDEKTHFKSTIFSYYNLPKFAILDPELIMTAPAHIAAACGVDALIHAMEAYLSNNANPFSDCFAEKAMELIGTNLRRFVANRHDEKAACAMMVGSNFAGIAFAWARLGNIHALSHPVSGFFGVAHGVANSVLMPAVMEYNALADIGRYEKIYNYVSVDKEPVKDFKPQMLVDLVTELNKELGIPENLRAVGVTEDKIHAMAVDAMKSGNIPANPRETTLDDVIALYHKAY